MTKRYPRKVIRHLQNQRQEAGIYCVVGERFPIQFIVTSQLPEEENFWLHNLTNDLKNAEDAEKLLRAYKNYQNDNLHQSLMDIIIEANKDVFKEVRGMCRALYELMEDEFKESEERGKEKTLISLVKDGLLSVTEAAKRLSISEEELKQKIISE